MSDRDHFRVIFVCTGNICRSPMAEAVFRTLAERRGLSHRVNARSAATGDWHLGERADLRTITALERRGYDGSAHRARQFQTTNFDECDLVIALDRTHERVLREWARNDDDEGKITLLRSFDRDATSLDVPDPYFADQAMFDDVLTMIETASLSLFRQLEPALRPPRLAPRSGGPS